MASALKAVGAGLLALLAALLGVVGLGALLLAAGVIAVDPNDFKPLVARQLSTALGREVEIAGDLQVDPGLQPYIVVHGLKIADAAWTDRPYMVEVPRLAVRLDVPSLIGDEVELLEVTLDQPAVTLERGTEGRANWQFEPERTDRGDGALPLVHSLRMNEGVLTYIDRPADSRTQVQFDGARGALTGPQRNLRLQASGRVNAALPLRLEASAEALAPTGDRPQPLRAELRLGDARVSADGTVAGDAEGALGRVELGLSVEVPSVAGLQPALPWELPDWPGFSLETRFVRAGTRVALEEVAASLGESDVGGRVALDTGGARPHISATLESRTLDLVQLMGRPSEGPGPLIPETPLPFGQLQNFDAALRYDARTVYVPQLSLDRVGIGVAVDEGLLRVDPLRFDIGEGQVRSQTLRIDTRSSPISVALDLDLAQIGLNAILQEFDVQANAFGTIEGGIDLAGEGPSPAAILGSAEGSIDLIMQEGQFDTLLAALAGQDITNILDALGLEEDARTPLRCFIADFGATDGILNARTLVLDTPDVLVVGAGDIDLDAQSINLALLPQHKQASVLAAQAPVHIAGPFQDVQFAVDTGAAVASLITPVELPDADDANCTALAEAARRE